ncbi:MAG: SGNH/GDSL hydrolase family protein [Pirellulales bacterium]
MKPPRIRKLIWLELGVLSGSFLLSLVVCELAVRWFGTVRNVGPAFSRYDPVYGVRLKPSFHCRRITPEFSMRFTTNAFGFRGPEPQEFPTGAVVFLGDSFTMGHGVNDGEEYPQLVAQCLERNYDLKDIPIVNASVGNTGNGRWIKFLEHEAARFQPRAVVMQVSGNDLGDNLREGLFRLTGKNELQEMPVPPAGRWHYAQVAIETVPGVTYLHLVGLLRQAATLSRSQAPGNTVVATTGAEQESAGYPLTTALVERAIKICVDRKWPALLIVVDLDDDKAATLRRACESTDTQLIMVPQKPTRPEFYYRVDGHWNATGHEYVAGQVAAELAPLLVQRPG